MSGAEHEHAVAVDGLLRTLGHFSDALARVERERRRAWWMHLYFLWGSAIAYIAIIEHWHAPRWLLAPLVLVHGGVAFLGGRGHRIEVQLAAWRLRRVYELASRLEDGGRAIDHHRRLELELRLSEAQFRLNRAQRLGEPTSTEARAVLRQRSEAALPEPAAARERDA